MAKKNQYLLMSDKADTIITGEPKFIASAQYSGNISTKADYNRGDYERFKSANAIPTKDHDIMRACRQSYEKIGIVRSVLDLQVELAIEGITFVSEHKPTENFFNKWAEAVSLQDRAEKFANHLLVEGNTVVRRVMGDISNAEVRKMRLQSYTVTNQNPKIEPGMIPIEYIFYNPSNIGVIGDELSQFASAKYYGIKISALQLQRLVVIIKRLKPEALQGVPEEIIQFANNPNAVQSTEMGDFIVPIPANRVYVAHYKKVDSDTWAKSLIYSILHDIAYNENLRVAKISTLEDWSNAVKLWKLGDHKEQILPSSDTINELNTILQSKPGGALELIWDSLISYEAHYPPIEKLETFEENYESILIGLGVHKSLVGGAESGTNNASSAFVGLRNMMKRVDGIRRAVKTWVELEVNIIVQNMGFNNKPTVKFNISNLFDQQSYYKLLTDLLDRDIISDRTLLEKIGEEYGIEVARITEQQELKDKGELPEKKGPFVQAFIPDNNVEATKSIEKTKAALNPKPLGSTKPKPKTGRPVGAKDVAKRNRRYRTKAEAITTAIKIQDKLDSIVDSDFLVYKKIGNKRQLSAKDREILENGKFNLLGCCSDAEFSSKKDLETITTNADKELTREFNEVFSKLLKESEGLTYDQRKILASIAYAEVYGEE